MRLSECGECGADIAAEEIMECLHCGADDIGPCCIGVQDHDCARAGDCDRPEVAA